MISTCPKIHPSAAAAPAPPPSNFRTHCGPAPVKETAHPWAWLTSIIKTCRSPLPEHVLLYGGALQLALHVGLSAVNEGGDGSQGPAGLRHAPLAVVHGCGGRPAESLASPDAASCGKFEAAIRNFFFPPPEGGSGLLGVTKTKRLCAPPSRPVPCYLLWVFRAAVLMCICFVLAFCKQKDRPPKFVLPYVLTMKEFACCPSERSHKETNGTFSNQPDLYFASRQNIRNSLAE